MIAVKRYLINSPSVCKPSRLTTHLGDPITFSDSVIFMRVSFWWKAKINLLSSSLLGTTSSFSPWLWYMIFWITSNNYYLFFSKSIISLSLLSLLVLSSFVCSARNSLYRCRSSDISSCSNSIVLDGNSFSVTCYSINFPRSTLAFASDTVIII